MPVFGRPGPHRYDRALAEWSAEKNEWKCLAENFRCDDRVSPDREQAFDRFVTEEIPSKDDLSAAVRAYHKERVRAKIDPDYVQKPLNAKNRIPLRNLDILLTSLLDVTGLELVFEWARSRFPAFSTYPSNRDKAFHWLRSRLDATGGQQFASHILEVLAEHGRQVCPFGPVWVTPHSDFTPVADQPSERWLEILGLRKARLKLCVIVLTYRARHAGTLYRPTQLDVGTCADHFPSPDGLGALTGHPVDLSADRRQAVLKTELIHGPFMVDIQPQIQWESSSFWYGFPQRDPTMVPNRALERDVHLELLEERYGPDVRTWFMVAPQEMRGNV